MSVLTSSTSFSFPDRLGDDYDDSGSGESSMTNSTLEFTVAPQKQQPSSVQSVAPETTNLNTTTNPGLSKSGVTEKRTQNVVHPKTVNGLIRSDIEYQSAVSNASKAAHHVIQTITYYTVMHRLYRSLERFYTAMCDKSRAEPNKFASAYQQAIDLSTIIMNKELDQKKHHNFMAVLKTGQKTLLNSFLTLVKSSPSFIASALLSMPTSDLNNFSSHSVDPFDDLTSLSRSRPLDILFYSFFPTDAPDLDRSEYFATICAQLLDHHKGERFCYEVFDKIISLSGSRYGPSLETLLLGLLQEGSFLTFPSAGRERSSSSTSSSSPSSEFSSPELGHASLATQSTTSLNSLYGQNRTQQFFESSVEKILEFLDSPAVDAIPKQFLQFSRLVLAKVESRTQRYALAQLVLKYFFHRHVHKLLTLPENFGLLKSSYINDIQRQRILLPLHQRLCHYISTAFPDLHHSSTLVSPKAKMHIDSIIDSFVSGDLPMTVSRDPAKNTTQLIVLAPSDVVCLYTSLFPSVLFAKPYAPRPVNMERKSSSTSSLGRGSTGSIIPFPENTYLTTATSFVSTTQNPYLNDHNYAYSSTSTNASSGGLPTISDLDMSHNVRFIDANTMVPPLPPAIDTSTSPISEESPAQDSEWSLEDIKNDVEPVIEEMMKKFPYLQFRNSHNMPAFRANKIQTFRLPHPLTERWQVFEVSHQGAINDITPETILEQAKITRGTSMLINPNFGHEMFLEDRGDESLPIAPANRGLFNQVKRAVEKIVTEVSNSCYPVSYYGSDLEDDSPHIGCDYVLNLLSDWIDRSSAKGQYLEASEYAAAVQSLKKILPGPTSTSYSQVATAINNRIISLISREKEQDMSKVKYQLSRCQEHIGPYEIYLTNAKAKGEAALTMLNDLRTKIWYVTEIRPSPLWNRAKDVARALTNGGNGSLSSDLYNASTPTSEQDGQSPHSSSFPGLRRNHSSSSLSSASVFSLKRLTSMSSKRDYSVRRQTIMNTLAPQSDGMFAPKEYTGENKLNDREAKATNKWLEGQKIQNLCTGEERIHRFCCEVDDLVRRIMGDALSNKKNRGHSLLTTSALFKTDLWRLILEIEGIDRSSTPSIHRSSTYHVDLDNSDAMDPREMKRATSAFERTQSARAHRTQKSSPNLIDMFSSMDIKPRKNSVPSTDVSPHDSGFESSSPFRGTPDSTSTINSHRRNRSLNDSKSEPKFNTGSFCQDVGYDISDDFDSGLSDKRKELEDFILDLQMRLTGMIYMDIGLSCWYEGSETDKWMNSNIVTASVEREAIMKRNMQAAIAKNAALQTSKFKLGDPPEQSSMGQKRKSSSGTHRNNSTAMASISESSSRRQSQHTVEQYGIPKMPYSESSETLRLGKLATPSMESFINSQSMSSAPGAIQFCHDEAYKNLLHRLSVVPSPLEKLQTLYTLEMLVVSSLSGHNGGATSPGSLRSYSRSNMASMSSDSTPGRYNHKSLGKKSSSSAITSLGEVIASVEAKRLSSQNQQASPFFPNVYGRTMTGPSTDTITEELRRVFKTSGMKSYTLFRDLQFIAAFVPPSVLDMTDLGKAFWDVSLAALSMKQETLNTLVDASSEIFQYASGMITTDMDHEFLSQWSLEDCAWLWSIAAKEDDTTGQRELAIMHLSHPHMTPLCLTPFSTMGEVFGPALLEDSKVMDDLDKCDPIRMAVVRHWMQRAASNGDNIANEYLMQQSPNGYI